MAGVRIVMVNLTFILMHPETHLSHPERANLISKRCSLAPTDPESTFSASKTSLFKAVAPLPVIYRFDASRRGLKFALQRSGQFLCAISVGMHRARYWDDVFQYKLDASRFRSWDITILSFRFKWILAGKAIFPKLFFFHIVKVSKHGISTSRVFQLFNLFWKCKFSGYANFRNM